MSAPNIKAPMNALRRSRRLDLPRCADPDDILLLGRFPCRMPRELDRGVVVVQRREPVLVLAEQREDEAELVQHTRVWAQRRVTRDHEVSEAVCIIWEWFKWSL